MTGLGNILHSNTKYTYTCTATKLSINGSPFSSTYKKKE